MSRGQKLEPVVPPIKLGVLKKSTGPLASGDWSREVEVDGRVYRVTVRRGQRVRIAFKPAGQNWGHRWVADVWRADAREGESSHLWSAEVTKSAGVRGILLDAGIVTTVTKWWDEWHGVWFWIGAVLHRTAHPECRSPDDGRFGRTERFDRVHICQHTCTQHTDMRWGRCSHCGAPPPRRDAGATP